MLERRVDVGDTVVYVDLDDPENKRQVKITIGSSNPEWGLVNVNTPIAQALLGAKKGDIVEALLPIGNKRLHILRVFK